ncbi:hypothetical protein PAXRUDRAFT_831082 [Paxillus rubicundulus Ve08.2h10]|uniref:YCII-related domain-containing protein n=1 Tax=Paxillus rubicundulus Ve08.2h10 TaxID=930991 RepID=A0A0D0DJ96_9AGAM|nr:hypothetical protein PAXRUDRAFT_831082 [Paxillus rubicundulus Ve08.2h10]
MLLNPCTHTTSRSIAHRFGVQQLQCFSSSARTSHPYIVWAPDCTDEGALARRLAVRPKHVVTANKLIKQGILKVAGGLLTPESQAATPQDRKFVGSVLIYETENIESARKFVEQDLYWTENVWDKEKLVVLPMIMATTLQEKAGITQPTPED